MTDRQNIVVWVHVYADEVGRCLFVYVLELCVCVRVCVCVCV